MSIVGRIRIFQAVVVLAVVVMAATAVVELRTSVHYSERVRSARQQLVAISQLAIFANRYSEQIAELLLVGEPERPDFDSARGQLSHAFADLRRITLQEVAALRDPAERDEERLELERLDRMQDLFSQIDRAVERLLLLDQEGRRAEAIALFRSDIENRLDAEFERLIGEAVQDERGEVRRIEEETARFTRLTTTATVATLGAFLFLTVAAGHLFARSIAKPIGRLTEGALALERGDLDHRIGPLGQDELGLLANRFDAMSDELSRQRAELVGARVNLERQVAERTGELAEANQQLLVTDAQRVRFLADVSHELRTPLTAIRGEAEVALRGSSKSQEAYQTALSAVAARAVEMSRLIEDLLFMARSEANEVLFDIRRVSLARVVSEAIQDANVMGRNRQIRIEFINHSSARELCVSADSRRLKQALLIPLDNAFKYSDKGTSIVVSLRSLDGAAAEIAIRDRGPGIAPDEVERVFDRFFRGTGARTLWEAGSGLGLPIARWLVEKQGGTIKLSSVIGEGTEVRMAFPIVQ